MQKYGISCPDYSKVQPAWNAWDVDPVAATAEKSPTEVGREATESLSPPSDDNHEELGVDALNTKSFDHVPRGHEVLMKECIDIYQEFFVTFLCKLKCPELFSK